MKLPLALKKINEAVMKWDGAVFTQAKKLSNSVVWFLSPQYLGHMSSVNLLLMDRINDTIFDPEEPYIIPIWFAINSSAFGIGCLIYECMNWSTSTNYLIPIHLSSPSAKFPPSWVKLKRWPRSVFWHLSLSLVIVELRSRSGEGQVRVRKVRNWPEPYPIFGFHHHHHHHQ